MVKMTFMDSLASNPSSGIYGQPGIGSNNDALSLVNRIKDREMQDFKNKADFMADLSLRQESRMRQLYDPNKPALAGGQVPQNVVMTKDPNEITPYQQADLGIRQRAQSINSQRLAQQGKLGEQALGIKTQQEALNRQKNEQINTQKQADLQRKIDESNQKLALAQQALTNKTTNAADQLQARKDYQAAVEERHQAEMDLKQHQFDLVNDQHQQQIKDLETKLKQNANTKTTTTLDPSGNTKTVDTQRGIQSTAPVRNPDGTYTVTTPDGRTGTIPGDKLDDWMKNYQTGGGDSQDQNEEQ